MMVGVIFILLALLVMFGFLSDTVFSKKKCTQEVDATIEEIVEGNLRVNGAPKYSAICKYYYQDVEYKEKVQFNVNKYDLEVGSIRKININPSNPTENYVKNSVMSMTAVMAVVVGSLFILVGAYVIYDDFKGDTVNIVDINSEEQVMKDAIESDNNDKVTTENNNTSSQNTEGQNVDSQKPTEQTLTDKKENTVTTDNANIHKINIFKVDKKTTQMLRKSPYYVEVYKNIQADPQYKEYGSDMTNVDVKGDIEYIPSSQLDRTIKEVVIYLPKDLKFVKKIGYNYYYQNNVTKSWLRIFIAPHKGNDVYARQMLNDLANYNKIFGDINIPILWNNNAFVTFDSRNANGDYLNVACSVNNKYMLYIEYNHKLGTKNNFSGIISTIKY